MANIDETNELPEVPGVPVPTEPSEPVSSVPQDDTMPSEPAAKPVDEPATDADGYYGDDDLQQSSDLDLSFLDEDEDDPEKRDMATKI